MKSFFSFGILASLALAGCTTEYFTPILDISVANEPISIVANCYLQNNMTGTMTIGKSAPPLSNNSDYKVSDATISFLEDGVDKGTWQKTMNAAQEELYYLPNFTPKPGKVYKATVSSPNLPTSIAIDTMPEEVPFTIVKTGKYKLIKLEERGGPGGGGNAQIDSTVEVKITFADNASTKDYYRLLILDDVKNAYQITGNPREQLNPEKGRVHTTDPVYTSKQGGIFGGGNQIDPSENYFTDITFNGKQKEITIYIPVGDSSGWTTLNYGYQTAYISLQHLSRAAYLHVQSVLNLDQRGPQIFTQPTLVYSNYKNGFGILGCATSKVDSVDLR